PPSVLGDPSDPPDPPWPAPPSTPAGAGPREKSAHAPASPSSAAHTIRVRRSEVIRHARAEEVVRDLGPLLQVHEVEEAPCHAPVARPHAEVVRRGVVAGQARLVDDHAASVVEG